MQKKYRCVNCQNTGKHAEGREFFAELPVCEECGADARKPRQRDSVLEMTIFHFDPPTAIFNVGENFLACQPAIAVNTSGLRATGDYRQVTCEDCIKTEKYKKASGVNADLHSTLLTSLPTETMQTLGN